MARLCSGIKPKTHIRTPPPAAEAERKRSRKHNKSNQYWSLSSAKGESTVTLFCVFVYYIFILVFYSNSCNTRFNICVKSIQHLWKLFRYFGTINSFVSLKKSWNGIIQMLEWHVENVELLYWKMLRRKIFKLKIYIGSHFVGLIQINVVV